MIAWLLATFGTALLGSVLPVANIELYLLGVLATQPQLNWWALALAAAVGQLLGKSLFHFAGRGSFSLGDRLAKMTDTKRAGRWSAWLEKYHDRCRDHPAWGLGILGVGAVTSFPPFTLLCFLTGAAGIPVTGFLLVSLAGRIVHFLLIAAAPPLLHYLSG